MIVEGKIITASEGMMLTNDEIYASSIRLGDWDSVDNYHEITIEEYQAKMAELEDEDVKL